MATHDNTSRIRSLEPIRSYVGEDVRLQLPGGTTVFDVKWVALWDSARGSALASVLVPDALNVPPAALEPHPYVSPLPHCKQLHRDFQVSWEVFGNQITIEMAAQVRHGTSISFVVSNDLGAADSGDVCTDGRGRVHGVRRVWQRQRLADVGRGRGRGAVRLRHAARPRHRLQHHRQRALRAGAGRVARRVSRRPRGRPGLQPSVQRASRERPHRGVVPAHASRG